MKHKAFSAAKGLLLAYLLTTVALPVFYLLSTVQGDSFREVFGSAQFFTMLKNSAVTALLATAISLALAFSLAFCLHRSNIRWKRLFVVLFTLPMLIPSISHGMGLVLLLGDNGLLTNLLEINIGLYGLKGIVMGSVLYAFPVAFLMFHDSLQYEDFTAYEAAQMLGLSNWRQFLTITLPGMQRTLVSAALAVFTMVFTDYGVPLMTGGTVMTLPVYLYREVIGMMDFSGGAVIGLVLLAPAVAAFLMDLRSSTKPALSSTVAKPYRIPEDKGRDLLVYLFFAVVVALLCLPVAAFGCLSFVKQYPIDMTFSLDTVKKLLRSSIGMYLVNSLAVALLTALVGTALSWLAACTVTRWKAGISGKLLHFLSMLPLAVPGVVLGLSYTLTFRQLPLYGTIFILVVVNIAHFFASPYLMACNCLAKFNPNMEDVAQSLGIGRLRLMAAVYFPSTMGTVAQMYSYYFVNAMITISAVSFLVNFRTMPLSLLIPQLESQSFIEGTALVSLLILGLNLGQTAISFFAERAAGRQPR